jgi:O-antigen/teichoic acid export membrane protein
MPANILSGIFRPIFVAMSRKPDADKLLSDLLSISIKLNWIFVLSAFCFLFFGGDPLLNQLSGGNYPTAGSVTAWLVLGLIAIAVHLNLSMYCLAMENSWPPLLATVASMVGLPLGLVLARTYGVVGVAAAFGFSELIWSVVCLLALHMGSHRLMQLDWLGFCKLICATVIALFLGTVFNYYFPTFWVLPAILTPGLFLAFVLPSGALTKQEQVWLATVLPLNKLPFFKPAR